MSHEPTTNEPQIPDRLSAALQAALREATPGDPTPSAELRAALAARLNELSSQHSSVTPSSHEVLPMTKSSKSPWGRVVATFAISAIAASIAIAVFLPANEKAQQAARREQAIRDQIANRTRADFDRMLKEEEDVGKQLTELSKLSQPKFVIEDSTEPMRASNLSEMPATTSEILPDSTAFSATLGPAGNVGNGQSISGRTIIGRPKNAKSYGGNVNPNDSKQSGGQIPHAQKGFTEGTVPAFPGIGFNPAHQQPNNGPVAASTSALAPHGGAAISGPAPNDPAKKNPQQNQEKEGRLMFGVGIHPNASPAPTGAPHADPKHHYNLAKPAAEAAPSTATPLPTIMNPEPRPGLAVTESLAWHDRRVRDGKGDPGKSNDFSPLPYEQQDHPAAQPGGEQYEQRVENIFQGVRAEPLSTFSIDVDTASYTNCRRFLDGRQLPPTAAVRVEEFINYFRYDYPQPTGKDPFSVNMEMADCPWTPNHKLLRIGLKGKEIDRRERPESNLVFLVDVSGSMSSEDKLPLLREALHRWVNELSANDRVTIVTYAGDAGLRLPTTRGDQKDKLHAAIETLQSGGSTHGSAGIKLAYEQATKNFLENGGVNRVLWATDGDLNVGTTSDDELVELITKQAKTGVFLTVLGVGTGNLKDAKLEKMADKGNGIYAYLDSIKEARKVLIEQMSGTTITIAKDVKIQIEFNPAEIAGYRLIGYENRILTAEDFANDKKDAGEIGAGHTVTALYEIIPVGADSDQVGKPAGEPLKYQAATAATGSTTAEVKLSDAAKTGELLTLNLRFKQPDGHTSELREFPLKDRGGKFTAASKDFQFAGCVAQLAMILRDSQYRGTMTTAAIAEIAAATKGEDKDGSRQEFVELVKRVQELGK